MQISTQQAINQAIAQFWGSLPTFIAVVVAWINTNARISGLNARMDARVGDLKSELSKQIELTRDLLRAEFRRVEEVTDARLKHLEER